METIAIPSPTAFLRSPILQPSVPRPLPKSAPRRQSTTAKLRQPSLTEADAATKPKQSKSRNGQYSQQWTLLFLLLSSSPCASVSADVALGCVTCKAKRLKCDEVKPSCQQCHKRNVTCGGYKKDFKWRPFEEATFVSKPLPPPRARKGMVEFDIAMTITDKTHSFDGHQDRSSPSSKPDIRRI